MAPEQSPPDAADTPIDPAEELASITLPWWRRYSPHGEFVWSTGISAVLHVFLVVLILILARPFTRSDPLPVAVDAVSVIDGDGLPENPRADEGMEGNPLEKVAVPEDAPKVIDTAEELEKVDKPEKEPVEIPVPQPDEGPGEEKIDQARSRINAARERLSRQLSQPGGPGGGRGGRAARWLLKFKTYSSEDYLAQLEGLGATLAFELAGRRTDRWRFFDRPSTDREHWEDRSLGNENRLFWIDDNRQAVQAVANLLRVSGREFMVAFLPAELEQRMLELELSYQGRREEEIASTVFEVVRRGGKYDVIVIKQTLKR